MDESVRVVLRIRPDEGERSSQGWCLRIKSKTDIVLNAPQRAGADGTGVSGPLRRPFAFDEVFGPSTRQSEVYAAVDPLVVAASEGYNATIFAYGCTGSGKTYTMAGEPRPAEERRRRTTAPSDDPADEVRGRGPGTPPMSSGEGIIPRAVRRFFDLVKIKAEEESDRLFLIRLTFVELYNDRFRDLLTSPSARAAAPSIQLRERASGEVFLEGSSTLGKPVTSAAEAMLLYHRGIKHRAVASTDLNQTSSRSHAVFTLVLESRSTSGTVDLASPGGGPNCVLRGRLHMIDLAGSERLKKSNARGSTRAETLSINRSLTALGDVLSALSKRSSAAQHVEVQRERVQRRKRYEQQRARDAAVAGDEENARSDALVVALPQAPSTTTTTTAAAAPPTRIVPYRNSKLTYLLKNSLGGNCLTLMIATVRTPEQFYHPTLMTIKYATRAKKIKNSLSLNVDEGDAMDNADPASMQRMHLQMEKLRLGLHQRMIEFKRLQGKHAIDAAEKMELKERLDVLNQDNARERAALEAMLHRTIHSHNGALARQRLEYAQLQKEMEDEKSHKAASIAFAKQHANALAAELASVQHGHRAVDDRMQTLMDERKVLQTTVQGLRDENAALTRSVDQAHQLREEDCGLLCAQAKDLGVAIQCRESQCVALAFCVEEGLTAQSELAEKLERAKKHLTSEGEVAAAALESQEQWEGIAAERSSEVDELKTKFQSAISDLERSMTEVVAQRSANAAAGDGVQEEAELRSALLAAQSERNEAAARASTLLAAQAAHEARASEVAVSAERAAARAVQAAREEFTALQQRAAEELSAAAVQIETAQSDASTSALHVLRLETECDRARSAASALQSELEQAARAEVTASERVSTIAMESRAEVESKVEEARRAVHSEFSERVASLEVESSAMLRGVKRDADAEKTRRTAEAATMSTQLIHAQSALAQALVERESAVADAVRCDAKMQQMMALAHAVSAEIAAGSENDADAVLEMEAEFAKLEERHASTMSGVKSEAERVEQAASHALESLTHELAASREQSAMFRSEALEALGNAQEILALEEGSRAVRISAQRDVKRVASDLEDVRSAGTAAADAAKAREGLLETEISLLTAANARASDEHRQLLRDQSELLAAITGKIATNEAETAARREAHEVRVVAFEEVAEKEHKSVAALRLELRSASEREQALVTKLEVERATEHYASESSREVRAQAEADLRDARLRATQERESDARDARDAQAALVAAASERIEATCAAELAERDRQHAVALAQCESDVHAQQLRAAELTGSAATFEEREAFSRAALADATSQLVDQRARVATLEASLDTREEASRTALAQLTAQRAEETRQLNAAQSASGAAVSEYERAAHAQQQRCERLQREVLELEANAARATQGAEGAAALQSAHEQSALDAAAAALERVKELEVYAVQRAEAEVASLRTECNALTANRAAESEATQRAQAQADLFEAAVEAAEVRASAASQRSAARIDELKSAVLTAAAEARAQREAAECTAGASARDAEALRVAAASAMEEQRVAAGHGAHFERLAHETEAQLAAAAGAHNEEVASLRAALTASEDATAKERRVVVRTSEHLLAVVEEQRASEQLAAQQEADARAAMMVLKSTHAAALLEAAALGESRAVQSEASEAEVAASLRCNALAAEIEALRRTAEERTSAFSTLQSEADATELHRLALEAQLQREVSTRATGAERVRVTTEAEVATAMAAAASSAAEAAAATAVLTAMRRELDEAQHEAHERASAAERAREAALRDAAEVRTTLAAAMQAGVAMQVALSAAEARAGQQAVRADALEIACQSRGELLSAREASASERSETVARLTAELVAARSEASAARMSKAQVMEKAASYTNAMLYRAREAAHAQQVRE